MKEKLIPVITKAGKICGRDAIFLDKINFINECTIEFIGYLNGSLCSNFKNRSFYDYKIVFNGIFWFKMLEIDFADFNYESSFDQVENSNLMEKLLIKDKNESIGKINNDFKHFIFWTYDSVFEIIGKGYDFELFN